MRAVSLRFSAAAFACALGLAACGNDRTEPADLFTPKPPVGKREARFPQAGMRFSAPANWPLERRADPGVFSLASGQAVVAGWAYRRREPLPRTSQDVRQASERLVEDVRERDPRFLVRAADSRRVDGNPAVEIRGEQEISRRRLRTRSVHVFRGEVEYVLEALAPPDEFARVNREVFEPLLRSLSVSGRVRTSR
jgi:hypothetical protein